MRVTQNILYNNIQQRISDSNTEMSKYNDQSVTGKRYQMPSGDSLNAARALGLKTVKANDLQYSKNVDSGQAYMTVLERTLNSVVDVMSQAKTLTIQGINATTGPDDRKILANEVDQLLSQLYALANTTDSNNGYIFSGFKTSTSPFDSADPTFTYAGDANHVQREVAAGTKLTISMTGSEVFGDGLSSAFAVLKDLSNALNANNVNTYDTPATQGNIVGGAAVGSLTIDGTNDTLNLSLDGVAGSITIASGTYGSGAALAAEIQSKINAAAPFVAAGKTATVSYDGGTGMLTITSDTPGATSTVDTISGNAATNLGLDVGTSTAGVDAQVSLQSAMTNVDTALSRAIDAQASIGARMASFDDWKSRLADKDITSASLISQAEDVDMTEAIMNLTRAQTAYKAILSSAANIMQMSLMDFLR